MCVYVRAISVCICSVYIDSARIDYSGTCTNAYKLPVLFRIHANESGSRVLLVEVHLMKDAVVSVPSSLSRQSGLNIALWETLNGHHSRRDPIAFYSTLGSRSYSFSSVLNCFRNTCLSSRAHAPCFYHISCINFLNKKKRRNKYTRRERRKRIKCKKMLQDIG